MRKRKRRFGRAGADDGLDLADRRAAMADRVAVGDLLVLVRLHEQPRPRPAEDGLQVGFQVGPLARRASRPSMSLPIVVGRGGDVERALLAALDLEARHAGRAQRRHVVRQGQVLHREREALARVALHRRAVAQRERGAR